MTTPTAPAPSTSTPTTPAPAPARLVKPHTHGLSPADAKMMAEWTKQDLASGKITQAQADTIFSDLNTPMEERALDTRTPEQKQLDMLHPPAKLNEYLIRYYTPGQEPPVIPQEVKQAEAMHRTWLAGAGFDRNLGNSLVHAIGKAVETTHTMTANQLLDYGESQYALLERAYGKDLDAKLQSAAQMIHELDTRQPGLKSLLKSRGIGDNAMVASMLIQQAERYHSRNRR
jgi:hypothetical protein